MKVEIRKVEKVFGIELIPKNEEEHGILERFWDGGVQLTGYSTSGDLLLTFADLIQKSGKKMTEENQKLFDKKMKELITIWSLTRRETK